MKEDLKGYPMLQAVDRVLDLTKCVQGINQSMPAELHAALGALVHERERLSFLQRQVYASPDELQRGDWIIIRGVLREAATHVRRATGAAQDPSWMQPAIQIADSRSKHRSEEVNSSGDLVIFSEAQLREGNGAGFWSNVDGWAELENATRFAAGERDRLYMPNSLQQDAHIVTLFEAEAKLQAYQDAVEGLEIARPW